jgi:hypothetical protein
MTQSVTFTIQSPPQLPEAALQYAVLNRIAALSQPGVDAWFSTLLQAQTGLSNGDFSTVSTLANQLHNQRAGIRQQIRMGITVPAHKSAASVESYASSLVSTEQQSEAGLPAVYLQSLQQSMGPAFSQLDAFAWSQVAPALYYCDDFCDPGDPGSPGGPSLPQNAWMLVDAAIYVNPNDGSLIAYADAEIAGFDPTSAAFDAYTCVNAAVTGINGLQQDCEEDLNASVQVFEYPPTVGTYTINAAGWYTLAADVAVNESSNNGYANASAQVNNAVSCAPTISSVQVNYQPTNAIAVGTTTNYGSLMVFGTCMDSTSQISIAPDPASDDAGDPTGLTVAISAPAGGTLVSAGYSIDPSAQPGSLVLTLTTAGGTATSPVEIVQSGPYIDLVSPDAWSPGTTTLGVTITGAGFGTIPGTVSVTAQNPSYPVNVAGIVSWGDGTIVMNVSTTAGDPGQDVTVTVTGGTYGQQFAQNQGAGKQAQGNAAVAASQCTDPALNKLIAEYMTFGSALHPTCASFQALQMVGTPAAMQHLSISVALGTNVPTSDLNWSLYNWAIVLPSLTTGLNSILANTAIGITSAYRNPVKENSGSSRHVFGDAADLNTQSSDTVWQTLFNSVHSALTGGVNYCIEPKAAADPPPPAGTKVDYSTNSHLHVDWRPGSCPNYWLQ